MSASARTSLALWLVGPVFLATAAWLALASPKADIPRKEMRLIPTESVRPGAWRTPLKNASEAKVGGQVRPCSECHRLFTPSPVETRELVQHKDITMHHGMNTRCFNCHDSTDRDKLVLHDGTLVDFDQAPRLCSQCHGTVYRDWQKGIHGKTMGSWDASSGKQHRLACNECHNPHTPAYGAIPPLPGPETMRMGNQEHSEEPAKKHAPLRRWSQPTEHAEPKPAAPKHDESKEGGR